MFFSYFIVQRIFPFRDVVSLSLLWNDDLNVCKKRGSDQIPYIKEEEEYKSPIKTGSK